MAHALVAQAPTQSQRIKILNAISVQTLGRAGQIGSGTLDDRIDVETNSAGKDPCMTTGTARTVLQSMSPAHKRSKPARIAYVSSILLALTDPVYSQSSFVEADFITTATQPANVGDAAAGATAYRASGAYETGLGTVDGMAADWLRTRAPVAKKPAIVLDIDETALSNWKVISRDDFGRPIAGGCDLALDAPCGWAAWDQLGRDPAIKPTLSLFEVAKSLKVAVFFITGRPEAQRVATERNLTDAGYIGYLKLFMVPDGRHFQSATDFKAPIRADVERQGYTIIANVGDQPSDLLGGHAEKKFLLPNPFYRVP